LNLLSSSLKKFTGGVKSVAKTIGKRLFKNKSLFFEKNESPSLSTIESCSAWISEGLQKIDTLVRFVPFSFNTLAYFAAVGVLHS
jgi:hypothetical protein